MKQYLVGFALLAVFVVPGLASAQIVTCGQTAETMCQLCDFIALGNNILGWIIGVMASVCAITVAVAGFKMATAGGDTGAVTSAKHMIWNVLIGFIILLSAWLIIDTVVKMLISSDGNVPGFGPWNAIQCVAQPTPSEATAPAPSGGIVVVPPTTPGTGPTQYSCAGSASCVPVSSTKVPNCVGGVGNRIIDPALAGRLESVGSGWCASTIGIEQGHSNPCHTTYGNCIDAKCTSASGAKKDCTASEAIALQNSFKQQGLWPVYEFPPGTSNAVLEQYRSQGLCAYIEPASTGAHFSVYVSRESGAGQFNKAGCP